LEEFSTHGRYLEGSGVELTVHLQYPISMDIYIDRKIMLNAAQLDDALSPEGRTVQTSNQNYWLEQGAPLKGLSHAMAFDDMYSLF
jgi:hypothetical protein